MSADKESICDKSFSYSDSGLAYRQECVSTLLLLLL